MHWYTVQGVISEKHGAAISFDSSMKTPWEFKVISEPIEYYYFPDMARNINGLPIVYISEGVYPMNETVYDSKALIEVDPQAVVRTTTQEAPFDFSENGAMIVFGTLIEKNSLLLKGSNNQEDWSISQADLDALSEFEWDLESANASASAIQQLNTEYEVPFLLSEISSKMANGDYKNNPSAFYADFEQLKEAAANTMNDTLTNVLNDFYANQQMSQPSSLTQLNDFFVQNAIGVVIISLLSTFIGGIIGYFIRPKFGKTKTSDDKKGQK